MWNKITQASVDSLPLRPHFNQNQSSSSVSLTPSLNRLTSGGFNGSNGPRLTPRSSSLNLSLSNSSNVSLASSTRQQSSSAPITSDNHKRAIASTRPSDVKDPVEVIRDILRLGSSEDKTPTQATHSSSNNDNDTSSTKAFDFLHDDELDLGGKSLHDYLNDVDGETTTSGVSRRNSINGPLGILDPPICPAGMLIVIDQNSNEKFTDLHTSIQACDEVLQSVESYLSSFKVDLGHVSAEIETLQNRSLALNTRLENRKTVERILGPVVDDISLSPNVIQRIAEGEVDDQWVKSLKEADKTIKALELRRSQNIKAAEDISPELDRLTHKALERVRDYFVGLIKSLRVPNSNVQSIQRTAFLKYKELFVFMSRHHPQLADEIAQAYVNTMRWYYLHHFTRYQKSLEKIKLIILDKTDLIGYEEPAKRSALLPTLKTAPTGPANYDPFNLGKRHDIYKHPDAPVPSGAMAEEDKTTHFPEYPFRCFNLALIDNACSEYFFLTDFFVGKKYDKLGNLFNQIFEPTIALGQAFTKTLIDLTMDSLAILLCVRINQHLAFTLQRRRAPVLENYINGTNMLLWPRLQQVMDAHSESLKQNVGKKSTLVNTAAPHALTQKFAQIMSSILILSADSGDDEPVANSLGRLRGDFEAFLTKLSSGISDSKKRERFLFNNYSLILTIISDTTGKLASEQKTHFQNLMTAFSS